MVEAISQLRDRIGTDVFQAFGESDKILALAEASAGIGVWDLDLATGLLRGTAQFFRLMGLEPTTDLVPIETTRIPWWTAGTILFPVSTDAACSGSPIICGIEGP